MFRIYISQRGLDTIAGGVMIGVVTYHNDYYPEFEQCIGNPIGSKKSEKLALDLTSRYDALFDLVPFGLDELELYRRIRITCENLLYQLVAKLGLRLKECEVLIDPLLPNITTTKTIKAKSVKKYPALHMTRVLIERERVMEINKLHILYPKFRLKYNQGKITPTHFLLVYKQGGSAIHRADTAFRLTAHLIDTILNKGKDYLFYKRFAYKNLPLWISTYYAQTTNKQVSTVRDLLTPKQLKIYEAGLYRGTKKVEDMLTTRVNAYRRLPEDMDNWFYQNAPVDLKDELLL